MSAHNSTIILISKLNERTAVPQKILSRTSIRSHVPEHTNALWLLWERRRVSEQWTGEEGGSHRQRRGNTRGLSLPRRTTRRWSPSRVVWRRAKPGGGGGMTTAGRQKGTVQCIAFLKSSEKTRSGARRRRRERWKGEVGTAVGRRPCTAEREGVKVWFPSALI